MNTPTFGLDIGTTSIKVLSLTKSDKTLLLESVASTPAPVRGLLSESEADLQFLADSVLELINRVGIKKKDAHIALPENQVFEKIIEMPSLSDQELSAALKWELEQHIPLPLSQVRTDWQVLERPLDEKSSMKVLLVAAPLAILEKYEKLLMLVGISARSLETELISAARALLPLTSVPEPSALVHIGASTTDVAIIRNGISQMISYINVGGRAVTRAVSTDLGVDVAHAEDLKRAYGLSQDVFEGKVGRALSPILLSLVSDIKKTVFRYKEKEETPIKQIILSGGTALLPGIDVFLTQNTGIQVVVGSCWSVNNIPNVPEELKLVAPSYNVVAGLALRDLL